MSAALSCFILSVARVVPGLPYCRLPKTNTESLIWFPYGFSTAVCFENNNVYFPNALAPRCVVRLSAPTCAKGDAGGWVWCGRADALLAFHGVGVQSRLLLTAEYSCWHRVCCDRDLFLRTHKGKVPQTVNAVGRWSCLQCWRPAVIY